MKPSASLRVDRTFLALALLAVTLAVGAPASAIDPTHLIAAPPSHDATVNLAPQP